MSSLPSNLETFLSITRLRIRSFRFVPLFALYTYRSMRQVRSSAGFRRGRVLMDRNWTFWTMTAWDSAGSMRRYMTSGAHKEAMPRLMDWCDEASVVHWEQETAELPSWVEADARMRGSGRVSKVRHPSPAHATLDYLAPRVTAGGEIRPVRR